MHSSNLNLSVIYTNNSLVPNSSTFYLNYRICLRKVELNSRISPGLLFVSSSRGLKLSRALHLGSGSDEFREVNFGGFEGESFDEVINLNNFVTERNSDMNETEIMRRRKISMANKGKVPWNKGKKHNAETRKLISQRTKEALNDPKVRKKMSECARSLSDQTKAKISMSITKLWKNRWKSRWKHKIAHEKFISLWYKNIAKAAKKGGYGEKELDWDSFEKIEKEIYLEHLERSAEVAKAKEMAQIRAERRAKAKADKAKLNLKKRVARVKGSLTKKKPLKKTKEEKEELAAAEDLKLKERLTKIHRKKSVNDRLSVRGNRSWEKLDLNFPKKDMPKADVSLADQLREVKNKKAEVFINGALTKSPHNHLSN